MNKTIVLATGNANKLREVKEILSDYNIVSCKDLGFNEEIIEDGKSFYENALIKAKTVAKALNVSALADDSGLCVDALNGEPGIYSARYAGDGVDEHNIQKLLDNLKDKKDRSAKFVCCLVFYSNGGKIITVTGETFGKIGFSKMGENGFGYDPVFISNDLNKTLAQASSKEKNSISHRGRALKLLKEKLSDENI